MSKLYIPHDMVYCILTWLSVKDLIKLKCVSKLWKSTIQSPEFVKIHIINHSFNSKSQKLICSNWKLDSHHSSVFGFLDFPEMFLRDQKSNFPEEIQCPGIFYENNNVVGTSRGIFCIQYTQTSGLYLCNPWIKECRKLPHSCLELFPNQVWYYNVYGFGYDELNDDFKVVKLAKIRTKIHPLTFRNEGKIYSLKSNKWKSIGNIPYWIHQGEPGFLFNHSLHWIFAFYKESFLSVDIRTGKHSLLPLPNDLRKVRSFNKRGDLGEFNGCLCISQGVINGFVIWLMKNYGAEDSWTKLEVFVSIRSFCDSRLIRYIKNDNEEWLVFMLVGVPYLFDFHEKKLYSREGLTAMNYLFSIESLVPLCHTDKSGNSIGSLYKRKRT